MLWIHSSVVGGGGDATSCVEPHVVRVLKHCWFVTFIRGFPDYISLCWTDVGHAEQQPLPEAVHGAQRPGLLPRLAPGGEILARHVREGQNHQGESLGAFDLCVSRN